MSGELFRSTGYATTIIGGAFKAEIGFDRIRIWLPDQRRTRIIRPSNLQSVSIQPNGYAKLGVRYRKDLIIHSTASEAARLTKALNALLGEREAVELRRIRAGQRLHASGARREVRSSKRR